MDLKVNRKSTVPIYLQISNGIKDLILSGVLPAGYRLPPERRLAESSECLLIRTVCELIYLT